MNWLMRHRARWKCCADFSRRRFGQASKLLLYPSVIGVVALARSLWTDLGSACSRIPAPCQLNRGLKVAFRNQRGPDCNGRYYVEAHPNYLDVDLSAVRLGGVDWAQVRRLAAAAEAGGPEALPSAEAIFHQEASGRRPLRVLRDRPGLHAAFAALLTDGFLQVQYQRAPAADEEEVSASASGVAGVLCTKLREVFCPLRASAPKDLRPSPELREELALPRKARRELGLIDPEMLCCHRHRVKPHWPKAWSFAERMITGEVFPPVRIFWSHALQEWGFNDGCHRYFAALISGQDLRVLF